MAERKQFLNMKAADPELMRLLEQARANPVTEEQLREQRVSFVYGNLPHSQDVTKESVRESLSSIRLRA